MKLLSPRIHGILDYVVVVAFLGSPTLLHLSGTPALIAYVLAGVHLTLTLVTAFPLGVIKLVPLSIHGALELVVSVSLVPLPWILGFASDVTARNFYAGAGIVIFTTWFITDYRGNSRKSPG
jgi:hypothetical protein